MEEFDLDFESLFEFSPQNVPDNSDNHSDLLNLKKKIIGTDELLEQFSVTLSQNEKLKAENIKYIEELQERRNALIFHLTNRDDLEKKCNKLETKLLATQQELDFQINLVAARDSVAHQYVSLIKEKDEEINKLKDDNLSLKNNNKKDRTEEKKLRKKHNVVLKRCNELKEVIEKFQSCSSCQLLKCSVKGQKQIRKETELNDRGNFSPESSFPASICSIDTGFESSLSDSESDLENVSKKKNLRIPDLEKTGINFSEIENQHISEKSNKISATNEFSQNNILGQITVKDTETSSKSLNSSSFYSDYLNYKKHTSDKYVQTKIVKYVDSCVEVNCDTASRSTQTQILKYVDVCIEVNCDVVSSSTQTQETIFANDSEHVKVVPESALTIPDCANIGSDFLVSKTHTHLPEKISICDAQNLQCTVGCQTRSNNETLKSDVECQTEIEDLLGRGDLIPEIQNNLSSFYSSKIYCRESLNVSSQKLCNNENSSTDTFNSPSGSMLYYVPRLLSPIPPSPVMEDAETVMETDEILSEMDAFSVADEKSELIDDGLKRSSHSRAVTFSDTTTQTDGVNCLCHQTKLHSLMDATVQSERSMEDNITVSEVGKSDKLSFIKYANRCNKVDHEESDQSAVIKKTEYDEEFWKTLILWVINKDRGSITPNKSFMDLLHLKNLQETVFESSSCNGLIGTTKMEPDSFHTAQYSREKILENLPGEVASVKPIVVEMKRNPGNSTSTQRVHVSNKHQGSCGEPNVNNHLSKLKSGIKIKQKASQLKKYKKLTLTKSIPNKNKRINRHLLKRKIVTNAHSEVSCSSGSFVVTPISAFSEGNNSLEQKNILTSCARDEQNISTKNLNNPDEEMQCNFNIQDTVLKWPVPKEIQDVNIDNLRSSPSNSTVFQIKKNHENCIVSSGSNNILSNSSTPDSQIESEKFVVFRNHFQGNMCKYISYPEPSMGPVESSYEHLNQCPTKRTINKSQVSNNHDILYASQILSGVPCSSGHNKKTEEFEMSASKGHLALVPQKEEKSCSIASGENCELKCASSNTGKPLALSRGYNNEGLFSCKPVNERLKNILDVHPVTCLSDFNDMDEDVPAKIRRSMSHFNNHFSDLHTVNSYSVENENLLSTAKKKVDCDMVEHNSNLRERSVSICAQNRSNDIDSFITQNKASSPNSFSESISVVDMQQINKEDSLNGNDCHNASAGSSPNLVNQCLSPRENSILEANKCPWTNNKSELHSNCELIVLETDNTLTSPVQIETSNLSLVPASQLESNISCDGEVSNRVCDDVNNSDNYESECDSSCNLVVVETDNTVPSPVRKEILNLTQVAATQLELNDNCNGEDANEQCDDVNNNSNGNYETESDSSYELSEVETDNTPTPPMQNEILNLSQVSATQLESNVKCDGKDTSGQSFAVDNNIDSSNSLKNSASGSEFKKKFSCSEKSNIVKQDSCNSKQNIFESSTLKSFAEENVCSEDTTVKPLQETSLTEFCKSSVNEVIAIKPFPIENEIPQKKIILDKVITDDLIVESKTEERRTKLRNVLPLPSTKTGIIQKQFSFTDTMESSPFCRRGMTGRTKIQLDKNSQSSSSSTTVNNCVESEGNSYSFTTKQPRIAHTLKSNAISVKRANKSLRNVTSLFKQKIGKPSNMRGTLHQRPIHKKSKLQKLKQQCIRKRILTMGFDKIVPKSSNSRTVNESEFEEPIQLENTAGDKNEVTWHDIALDMALSDSDESIHEESNVTKNRSENEEPNLKDEDSIKVFVHPSKFESCVTSTQVTKHKDINIKHEKHFGASLSRENLLVNSKELVEKSELIEKVKVNSVEPCKRSCNNNVQNPVKIADLSSREIINEHQLKSKTVTELHSSNSLNVNSDANSDLSICNASVVIPSVSPMNREINSSLLQSPLSPPDSSDFDTNFPHVPITIPTSPVSTTVYKSPDKTVNIRSLESLNSSSMYESDTGSEEEENAKKDEEMQLDKDFDGRSSGNNIKAKLRSWSKGASSSQKNSEASNFLQNYFENHFKKQSVKQNKGRPTKSYLDMKKNIESLFDRFVNEEFTENALTDIVEGCKSIAEGDYQIIVRYVVKYCKYSSKEQCDFSYSFPLNPTQQRLFTLIIKLEQDYPAIINHLLDRIHHVVCNFSHHKFMTTLYCLARFFTAFCKFRNYRHRAQIFCYDALYCLKSKSHVVIFAVLTAFPECFPNANSAAGGSLTVQAIVNVIYLFGDAIKYIYTKNLRTYLSDFYCYKRDNLPTAEILLKQYTEVIKRGMVEEVEQALLLLSKLKSNWKWTHEKIIKGCLLQTIDSWRKGNASEATAAWCIKVCAYLAKTPPYEKIDVSPLLDVFENLLFLNTSPPAVKEACIFAFALLVQMDDRKVYNILKSCKNEDYLQNSKVLGGVLNNVLKRRKSSWWIKFFQAR